MLSFKAYIHPLSKVSLFLDLGRNLSTVDENFQAVVANLRKARKLWDRLLRILGRKGAD